MSHPVAVSSRPSGWNQVLPFLGVAAVVLLAVSLLPAALLAQLPNTSAVSSALQDQVMPIVHIVRMGLVAACVLMAIFAAWKAAKGDNNAKEWIKFVMLLIVAGVAADPGAVLSLLGLTKVAANLTGWGIID